MQVYKQAPPQDLHDLVFLLWCDVRFLIFLFQEVARARKEFMETFRSLKLLLFVTMIVNCHHFDSLSISIIATITSIRIFAEPQPTGFLASLPPGLFRILKRFANLHFLVNNSGFFSEHCECYSVIITSFLPTIRWQPAWPGRKLNDVAATEEMSRSPNLGAAITIHRLAKGKSSRAAQLQK